MDIVILNMEDESEMRRINNIVSMCRFLDYNLESGWTLSRTFRIKGGMGQLRTQVVDFQDKDKVIFDSQTDLDIEDPEEIERQSS